MFANYHQMQHFITESPWDYRALMDQVSGDVSRSLPKRKLTGLLIDESSWEKKGDKASELHPNTVAMSERYPTHRLPYSER